MKKDAQLTIRLSSALKAALQEAAARRDRKPNWLVVDILTRWLERQTKRRSSKQP